jgi:hypothetical protein
VTYVFDMIPVNEVMKRMFCADFGRVCFGIALADYLTSRDGKWRGVSADALVRRKKYGGRKGRRAALRLAGR